MKGLGHIPWIVDIILGDFRKFRAPFSDVLTLGIEFSRLQSGIEDENTAGPDSTGTTPASIVGLDIVINQLLLEVVSSPAPVLFQVHGQVACDNHSSSIRHEACLIHLPHQCVNQGHASSAIPPSLDRIFVDFPCVVFSVVDAVSAEYFVAIVHAPVSLEVTPKDLVDVNLGAFICFVLFLKILNLPVDLTAGN